MMNLMDLGEYQFKFDFQIPKIQFILVSEAFQSFIPFLKLDIFMDELSMASKSLNDMSIKTNILLHATYYNNKIGIWEPLLEKFEISIRYIFQHQRVGIKVSPLNPRRNALKLNVTPEFIKLLSKAYYFFD